MLTNLQIGKILKDSRKTLKLSLTEVSNRLKITRQTLEKYEQGKSKLSFETIGKLCDIYKITPNYLFTGHLDEFNYINQDKQKTIYLLQCIMDNDIEYDCLNEAIYFKNKKLKSSFTYCFTTMIKEFNFTKLTVFEKIFKYLDQGT